MSCIWGYYSTIFNPTPDLTNFQTLATAVCVCVVAEGFAPFLSPLWCLYVCLSSPCLSVCLSVCLFGLVIPSGLLSMLGRGKGAGPPVCMVAQRSGRLPGCCVLAAPSSSSSSHLSVPLRSSTLASGAAVSCAWSNHVPPPTQASHGSVKHQGPLDTLAHSMAFWDMCGGSSLCRREEWRWRSLTREQRIACEEL